MINKEQLIFDLYIAFANARKHKASKYYVKEFERHLHENITQLAEELYAFQYKSQPLMCFIITDPKKREVFASSFRDRIVHHLYYNYTHEIFEKGFVYDSYSCIKGKGTHFGINRLEHHIKSESLNYTKKCYILKLDIRGYFMHINRTKLYELAINTIRRKYEDDETKPLVEYLTKEIILLDPTKDCQLIGSISEWRGLPKSKSIRYSKAGCGLPIGNLTSQLFSNVYLNILDQYCKRELKFKHYGRYVDDAYIVSQNKDRLKLAIPQIESFLKEKLELELHLGKTKIYDSRKGVEYLGAYLKPYRRYISTQSLSRMRRKIRSDNKASKNHYINAMLSRFGVLSHYSSHNIKMEFIETVF